MSEANERAARATIQAKQESHRARAANKARHQMANRMVSANKQLAADLLEVQYDVLKNTHEQLLIQKEKEIIQLNEIIKDEISDHSHWWFAAGVISGVLLSIGIFYAAVEVQN